MDPVTVAVGVAVKVIDLLVSMLGKDTVSALLSEDAVKRDKAIADYVESLKFPNG